MQVQELTQMFPDGMKVTLIEGEVIDIENEKLTDVWSYCKPETSQYIYADGMGLDMMGAQDLKNDFLKEWMRKEPTSFLQNDFEF